MALGDVGPAVIDDLLLLLATNTAFAARGGVCHGTGDFFVSAYHDPLVGGTLNIESFEVDDDGNIAATAQSLLTETDGLANMWPDCIKCHDGVICVVYYRTGSGLGHTAKTYTLDVNGDLTAVGTLDLSTTDQTGAAQNSAGIWATEHANTFVAGYYEGAGADLTIATFTVDTSGNFSAVLDTQAIGNATTPLGTGRCGFTWSGQGDFYVLAFTEAVTGDGFAATHEIGSGGLIAAEQSTLEYNATDAGAPSLSSDDAGRIICMYSQSGNIRLETFDVDVNGDLTDGPGSLTSFVSTAGFKLIRIDEADKTNYVGVGNDNCRTWNVDGSGNVSQIDLLQFIAQVDSNGACVLKPSNTTILVCVGFETVFSAKDWKAWTILVESVGAAAAGGVISALPNMMQREILL